MKYKLLGNSGLRVSELCLGTMTFGLEWGWGSDFEQSREVFEAFAKAGGNFLDTANRYTEGTSEKWLGEFISQDRDHFVLATKFALKDRNGDANFAGNHRKNMMRSVSESLRRLNTEYIDLLWIHAWDFTTHPEEVMRGLDDLVTRGLVHYIGVSDTPAWMVARCNTMAELRGWSKFAALQVEYNLLQRSPEADLLPMAKALDLAVTPWAPLAGGALTGKYLNQEPGRVKENSDRRNQKSLEIASMVVEIAQKLELSPAVVALQWIRQRDQVIIPIVGARLANQLNDSLACVHAQLPADAIEALNKVSSGNLGFPHEFLQSDGVHDVLFAGRYSDVINHRREYLR
jgi:aryl-alcohol dehydrogenase-like predicted oxidoreductase